MSDIKRALTHLGLLYLLLAFNVILNTDLLPSVFPFENLSSLYLLFLSVCLILRYILRVAEHGRQKTMMLCMACMIFLLNLLRCIKYSIFGNHSVWGRYTWYAYYIPMLLIPLLFFYASCHVYANTEQTGKRSWGWAAVLTAFLILLVLTNDLHQQVFCFHPGFADWDSEYSHGWLFLAAAAWQSLLYAASVIILLARSSIEGIRSRTWLILLPFALGSAAMLLLVAGCMPKLNGTNIIQLPEALCFMTVGVLECCMQLGLIPGNENYQRVMQITSLPVQITDSTGTIICRSPAAGTLTEEQFYAPDHTRIGDHVILKKIPVFKGYGFWQIDVTELDRLEEELAEVKQRLTEETDLIRLQNSLKKKHAEIELRSLVYDDIAQAVRKQSKQISFMTDQAMKTDDARQRDRCCRHIMLLGAYIKRYANMMLLRSENEMISTGELGLSVTEVLRYLNLYGTPGEITHIAAGSIPADQALAIFEVFEFLIEENLNILSGVYAGLFLQEPETVFKITLENMQPVFPKSIRKKLATENVRISFELEDNIGYCSFSFPEGGKEA